MMHSSFEDEQENELFGEFIWNSDRETLPWVFEMSTQSKLKSKKKTDAEIKSQFSVLKDHISKRIHGYDFVYFDLTNDLSKRFIKHSC